MRRSLFLLTIALSGCANPPLDVKVEQLGYILDVTHQSPDQWSSLSVTVKATPDSKPYTITETTFPENPIQIPLTTLRDTDEQPWADAPLRVYEIALTATVRGEHRSVTIHP